MKTKFSTPLVVEYGQLEELTFGDMSGLSQEATSGYQWYAS